MRRICAVIISVTILATIILLPSINDISEAPIIDIGAGTPTEVGQHVERQYDWTYGGQHYSLTLFLSMDDYYNAINIDRSTTTLTSYANYLTPNDQAVLALADSISSLDGDPALMMLSFVRSLDYRTDMDGYGVEEYPAYPIETLVNGYGDCEDLAALYVSVMHALGRDAALLAMLDTPMGGHMAAGIAGPYDGAHIEHDGITYYYAETTTHLDIGRVPASLGWGSTKVYVLGAAS
ncbi:MAG: hypothetical protein GX369_01470 [Euryarchaeota archaeon]|nr:hypothetical protein [Euryarchaeota archaeon]